MTSCRGRLAGQPASFGGGRSQGCLAGAFGADGGLSPLVCLEDGQPVLVGEVGGALVVERGEFHLRLLQCRLLAGQLCLQLLLFLDGRGHRGIGSLLGVLGRDSGRMLLRNREPGSSVGVRARDRRRLHVADGADLVVALVLLERVLLQQGVRVEAVSSDPVMPPIEPFI